MARFLGYSLKSWVRGTIRVWTLAGDQNISLISAGCAFYGLLALFPATGALISILGLISDPTVVADQMGLLQDIVPDDAYVLLNGQVMSLVAAGTDTLTLTTVISLVLAIWSARAGTAALIRGLNAINQTPNRSGLRHYLTAIALTLMLMGLAVVAILTIVVTPIALAFLPLGDTTALILEAARWMVGILVLIIAISLLYRFAPNRKGRRMKLITPGAFVAVAAWIGASVAFNIYLSNFGNYNEVYGSLGAVIALLMWLYISAYLVLLGAALNVTLETGRAAKIAAATQSGNAA